MPIIRKKLFAAEVSNPRLRINATTGEVESSPDGGTTWIPSPGEDPRHADAFRLPALSTGTARCDAAARITAELQEALAIYITDASAALIVTNILALFLLLTGPIGWAVDAMFAVGTALASIGIAAITAAFTSEVWDEIQCIIYDNLDEDGQMSLAQSDAIYAEIFANYSSTISGTYAQLNSLFGEVLFSNAGVERTETGDCDYCAPTFCDFSDFTDSERGYTVRTVGLYQAGFGWRGQYQDTENPTIINISRTFDERVIDSVEFAYARENGGGANYSVEIQLYLATNSVFYFSAPGSQGSWYAMVHAFGSGVIGVVADEIRLTINNGANGGNNGIGNVTIIGQGTDPFDGVEC